MSTGAFVEHEVQWTPWVRTNLACAPNRYWFAVRAGNAANAGVTGDGLFSPKASAIFGPWRRTSSMSPAPAFTRTTPADDHHRRSRQR